MALAATLPDTPPARPATSNLRTRPLARNYGGDPRSLELAASIERHQRRISEQDAAMISEIAEFNGTEAWRGDGAFSMQVWLVATCHVGAERARALVTAAHKLDALPKLRHALAEGDITLDVLTPLIPFATPDNDAELADKTVHMTPRQARKLATDLKGTTQQDAINQFHGRYVRFNDDTHSLSAKLTKDGYAAVKSALTGRARIYDHVDPESEEYERFDARCADALVELATEGGKRSPGSGPGTSRIFSGTATTVVVHVDLELLLRGDGYGYASIEGVGPITAEMARRLACDADVTISFDGPDGTCLDQKPLRRDPTPAQRIEIRRRDGGCRWPGCPCHNVTDVHHVVWASKQGKTVLSNLLTLCVGHHSRVHELGWKVDGDANDKVSFTSPHGHTYVSMPSPSWHRSARVQR